mmetsp:Transcript_58114/g.169912  ORF Transcript_58114/g.169912 Transcript_58114/m.169912 type:complete len:228 (-) Transcript_58114:347-1030(-)
MAGPAHLPWRAERPDRSQGAPQGVASHRPALARCDGSGRPSGGHQGTEGADHRVCQALQHDVQAHGQSAAHVQEPAERWQLGHGGRLPAGLRVDQGEHSGGRPRHGLVGLRLPDHGHCEPHLHRGREHVEPRAHRHAGPHHDELGEEVPQRHAAPGGLRPGLGGRPRRRHGQVPAPGAHRQLRLPGPLRRRRPPVQEVQLLQRRIPHSHDGRLLSLQGREPQREGWG